MSKINTILFDYDGTLMDTHEIVLQSWQHTFKTLEGKERPEGPIIKSFGEPLTDTLERVLPNAVEEAAAVYRDFHFEHFRELISLFPGMEALLITLKERGYKLGIVTSRYARSTMIGLEKYDVAKHFDAIVTCEQTTRHKPDPEPVLVALETIGAKAEETIMVGDTMLDIRCARGAGVRSVMVGWSMVVEDEDLNGPDAPDFVIRTADELLEIINALC